ncbi:MAG TPA: hypothetical protein VK879_19495, partial [Candidatus Sulfomarinibacteraceae bacterium]|nr:hypothetical protein [Candidatus Sulfomarinibacteraceae bacterium]
MHLIEKLTAGLSGRLILVSAPAGYGKTTLAASWVQGTGWSSGWVSLDESDNDPGRFLRYLAGAMQNVDEAIGDTANVLLQAPQLPPAESILAALINDLVAYSAPAILVLDDYHLIASERVHQAVTFLLDNTPANLRLVIITRAEPPLPIARLRARGQLTEITQAELRFKNEEITEFFNRVVALDLTPEQITALETRTEGWIAALQLAASSLPGQTDVDRFIAGFGGSHRHVVDYLAGEVFRQQPAEVRQFLQTTAVLERFTASLCDALLDRDDSRRYLNDLE